MSVETNRQVMERDFAAVNRGDEAKILTILSRIAYSRAWCAVPSEGIFLLALGE
jgi:hypothetical protein